MEVIPNTYMMMFISEGGKLQVTYFLILDILIEYSIDYVTFGLLHI